MVTWLLRMRRVVRGVVVAEDPERDGEEDSLVALDERFEAPEISCPASGDECEVICILIDIHTAGGKVGNGSHKVLRARDDISCRPNISTAFHARRWGARCPRSGRLRGPRTGDARRRLLPPLLRIC